MPLLTNTRYKDVKVSSATLSAAMNCSQDIVTDGLGSLFPTKDIELMEKNRVNAVHTIAVTYALYKLAVQIPKECLTADDKKQAAVELRASLVKREGFKIPKAMCERLVDFGSPSAAEPI